MKCRSATVVAVVSSLAACSGGDLPSAGPSEAEAFVVPIDRGDFDSVTWLANGDIVYLFRPNGLLGSLPEDEIWSVRPDGSDNHELDLPFDEDRCPPPSRWYDRPVALWDGRLGMQRTCSNGLSINTLVAFDVETEELEELSRMPELQASNYTWNPEMNLAIVTESSHMCSTFALAGFGPDGNDVRSYEVIIDTGEGRWGLDEAFERPSAVEPNCTDFGRVDRPAWSPDGERVAFFASPASIGVAAQARLEEPWILMTMSPDGEDQTVRRDERMLYPSDLSWSPDGRWLAYNLGSGADEGVWILEVDSGEAFRITTANGDSVAWSPDGRRLVSVRLDGPDEQRTSELVIHDVSSLVGG